MIIIVCVSWRANQPTTFHLVAHIPGIYGGSLVRLLAYVKTYIHGGRQPSGTYLGDPSTSTAIHMRQYIQTNTQSH